MTAIPNSIKELLSQLSSRSVVVSNNDNIDLFEKYISEYPPVECDLNHRFTNGLYSREIFMPAGSVVTSRIHKTQHQFAIIEGEVSVWTKATGMVKYQAPYVGITEPGTRRVLFNHTDVRWVTFHPTPLTTVEEIEKDILEPHINKLLEEQTCLG